MIKFLCKQAAKPAGNIILEGTTVIKEIEPKRAGLEAVVSQSAHRLSQTCGLFYSPRVLDFNSENGTLKLERLDGIVSLKEYLGQSDDGVRVIRKVGRALAFVHSGLDIPSSVVRQVPRDWRGGEDDTVVLHGDFNMINVCYKEDSDQVIILDWATAPALTFAGTVGPRQLDLAHFLRSLLLQQKEFFQAIRLFPERADAFLDAYMEELGREIDMSLLGEFLIRLNLAILRKQWRHGMVISMAQTLLGQVILRKLAKRYVRTEHLRQEHADSLEISKMKGKQ